MDFTLSEEQILLKNTVRDFMKSKNVHGWIEDAEKNKEFPRPFMREAALLGLLGMNVGEEYGGAGLSYLDAVIVIEEMAYWSISFSLCVLVQNSLGTFPLSVFGSSYQKSLILPVLCSGEKFICFANTEPGVGSDAKNISTSAKKIDEYNWSLNGVKRFITNASVSDWATVSARTSIRKPGHPGITTYLINIEPGINGYEFRNFVNLNWTIIGSLIIIYWVNLTKVGKLLIEHFAIPEFGLRRKLLVLLKEHWMIQLSTPPTLRLSGMLL
jgi:alkylation response protein AidB-like acyl-CoA dehydrogenase